MIKLVTTANKIYTSSSNYASNTTPDKAFNEITTTNGSYNDDGWLSNTTSNAWLSIDLETPNNIIQVGLTQLGYDGVRYRAKDFIIQYSDDNVNWFDAYTNTLIATFDIQIFTFNSVGKHRYWRLFIINPLTATTKVGISEWYLYANNKYYLIQDKTNNNIYSLDTGGNIILSPSQIIDEANYINNGFDDITLINNTYSSKKVYGIKNSNTTNGQIFSINVPTDMTSVNSINLE